MIIKSAEYITSAVKPSQYPPADFPEIAFVGRSNVGKSSLINTLVNRKRLAKTSSTPGRTQLVNFFLINNAFSFVDLPGYGYARVPAQVKKKWAPMVEKYLTSRSSLSCIIFIIDIRRTPGPEEINLKNWFSQLKIPVILVLTKVDKLKKSKYKQQIALITKNLSADPNDFILFSSKSKKGINAVWDAIGNCFHTD